MKKLLSVLTVFVLAVCFGGTCYSHDGIEEIQRNIQVGKSVNVAYVSLGESGRRAVDGLLATVGILTSTGSVEGVDKIPSLKAILDQSLGTKGQYKIEEVAIEALEEDTIPPTFSLDEDKFNDFLKNSEFDIVVVYSWNWYEHTKYKNYAWDEPPLEMDIDKNYSVYIGKEEVKTFSYSVSHSEPSGFSSDDEAQQKSARLQTARALVNNELSVWNQIQQYFQEIFPPKSPRKWIP